MRIGLYQHASAMSQEVAEAISAMGAKVQQRNALYFNERETEKFDGVIVDDGQNTAAITDAYTAAGVKVVTLDEFLSEGQKSAKAATTSPVQAPKPAAAPEEFNPDAPRVPKSTGRNQGKAKAK